MGDCPIAEQAFERWITMNIYEHYREFDIDEIAHGIGKVASHYKREDSRCGLDEPRPMTETKERDRTMNPSPIRGLRWWIAGLLFLCTVINYIDRQTLNVLGPILQETYSWTKEDFAVLLIAFRIGYTIMQCVSGRLLDWIGTYAGVASSVRFIP